MGIPSTHRSIQGSMHMYLSREVWKPVPRTSDMSTHQTDTMLYRWEDWFSSPLSKIIQFNGKSGMNIKNSMFFPLLIFVDRYLLKKNNLNSSLFLSMKIETVIDDDITQSSNLPKNKTSGHILEIGILKPVNQQANLFSLFSFTYTSINCQIRREEFKVTSWILNMEFTCSNPSENLKAHSDNCSMNYHQSMWLKLSSKFTSGSGYNFVGRSLWEIVGICLPIHSTRYSWTPLTRSANYNNWQHQFKTWPRASLMNRQKLPTWEALNRVFP